MSEETKDVVFDEAQLKAALKENYDKTEAAINKANAEAKDALSVSTEARDEVKKLTEQGKEIMERLSDIEARKSDMGGAGDSKSEVAEFLGSTEWGDLMAKRVRSVDFETKTTLVNATRNSAQPLVAMPHVAPPQHLPNRRLRVWDALPKGAADSNVIPVTRETYTNNAGPQVAGSPLAYTEGATKPESAFSYTQVLRPVETMAHTLPVSTQLMEDAPFMESYLQGRMIYGLELELEDQVLNGSGANGNLSGLVTEATAYAPSYSPSTGDRIKRIRDAIRQLQANDYVGSIDVVVNPNDWFAIETQQINSTDNRYTYGDPGSMLPPTIWGHRVIVSNSIASGSFLVGDIAGGAQVFQRGGLSYGAFYQDGDNVKKNLVTLRAEARLALVVWRTEAFITGSFSG